MKKRHREEARGKSGDSIVSGGGSEVLTSYHTNCPSVASRATFSSAKSVGSMFGIWKRGAAHTTHSCAGLSRMSSPRGTAATVVEDDGASATESASTRANTVSGSVSAPSRTSRVEAYSSASFAPREWPNRQNGV